jgi:hypothetical protein
VDGAGADALYFDLGRGSWVWMGAWVVVVGVGVAVVGTSVRVPAGWPCEAWSVV